MELKEILPIITLVLGWLLAEGSAFWKREIERRRILGRAISLIYFQFSEMVQVKIAQEHAKGLTSDIREWERARQRAFDQYTVQSEEYYKSLIATSDELGAFYPIEAFELRNLLWHYRFFRSRKLNIYLEKPTSYMTVLATYEMAHMVHQYKLEKMVRFLSFRQSKVTWLRLHFRLLRLKRMVPKEDMVFLQQTKSFHPWYKLKSGNSGATYKDAIEVAMKSAEDDLGDKAKRQQADGEDAENASIKS